MKRAAIRLQAVVDTAVDGVILIDATGGILMFNPACERLFGYNAEEVQGKNVKLLMPAPFQGEHDQYLRNFRETGERKIIGIGREVVGQRKDGSTFPMQLSVGEAKQEEDVVFVGIIHDLTERKRTEEQLRQAQKMEMVGQLSGGLAHDFNNLLTVIIGNADMLSEKLRARPDLRQFCETIISAAERGAELTRRLLAFGRKQALQPKIVNCNELVNGLKLIFGRTLREDIEILTFMEEHLALAFADMSQLESSILNLALNAQDAMPNGGTLSIRTENAHLDGQYRETHPEVIPGAYVLVSITDDGMGMDATVAERAFEPFFTTKDVGKGSGLGLSMVYGFIKQSNGHVTLYSEPGLGTTVKLYIPAAKGTEMRHEDEEIREVDSPQGSGTILVVEDDPFVRGYAVGCVESLGYQVITATNGREALRTLDDHLDRIDMLFSDIVMPGGVGGWELAQKAWQKKPGLKVLLTSGYQLETMAGEINTNPHVSILNKPYRKTQLAQRIREILQSPKMSG
jgi:PAS domain S-box-containing protein